MLDTGSRTGISVEIAPGEYTLSLKAFFRVLWRRAWAIALATAIFTGAVVGYGLLQEPVYEARAEILIREQESASEESIPTAVVALQQLIGTVVEAVNSRRVAEAVIQDLELSSTSSSLLGNLSVEQIPDTQFIQIYYRDTDAERAKEVANAVARVSSDQISEVSPSGNAAISVTVWESAVESSTPVSPQLIRNGLLALMLGLIVGIGLALLLEYLDDSWRSPEEVELVSGVPTFGVIPKFEASKRKSKAEKGGG